MAKQFQVCILLVLGLALTCRATMYNVGDSSGWDVSSDLDNWPQGKKFVVGDVLAFQYSSSDNVEEVTKESYDGCNVTKFIQSSSTGNSTFTLSSPGDWYFISGNKLYCLGGMKLHVNVDKNPAAAAAPAPAPESGTSVSSTSNPSSKSNKVDSSSAPVFVRGGVDSVVLALMGLVAGSILCFG